MEQTYQLDKLVLHIVFLLTLFIAKAQENLVPNGSFEEYYSCPESNDLNDGQLEHCKGWWKPTKGTSDYFNECNHTIVSVPANFWGYQQAFQGHGYVGIVPIEWNKTTGEIVAQEYIQTKLSRPLKPCTTFHLSFYVSCADLSHYAIGKLGAYFSKHEIQGQTNQVLEFIPQVRNQQIISDTINWIKIESDFIATGGEEYLTIGYFSSNFAYDTMFIQTASTPSVAPYYYIDSVSVIEIGEVDGCDIKIPNIFSPNSDGINDQIDFSYLDGFEELDFRILNRWGNVIFKYDANNIIWDGTTPNGEPCTDGVYFYVLNSKTTRKTGFIQLIR
ncbi:gliding motility-associated C-terminal domain-containing protein [Fluviicola sp.]|uniref:gliding motility-associated C-terminal domain-containing protein n=1 Tax=Fluviicola sp. TaxID=1917219 RepID=UPI0031E1BAED